MASASSFLVHQGAADVSVNDNQTRFAPVGGPFIIRTTEAEVEGPVRDACTFKNLWINITSNTASNTSTVTIRKSRADTAVIISVGAGATGILEDTVNSVAFAATDEASLELTIPSESGTHTIAYKNWGVEVVNGTANAPLSFMANAGASPPNFNAVTTYYVKPNSGTGANTTEANQKYRIRSACTAKDLYCYVTSNSINLTNTVVTSRVNGAAGAQTFNIGAAATGAFEVSSGSDSLAVGDDFDIEIAVGTATGAIVMSRISCTLKSTNNTFHMLSGVHAGTTLAVAFNTTTYSAAAGDLTGVSTTESDVALYPRVDFTAKELCAFVSANTIATSNSTITLRDNLADSSVVLTIGAGATGIFTDSSNTATITAGTDEIDYKIVTPNTSGTLTLRWISSIGEVAAEAVTVVGPLIHNGYTGHLLFSGALVGGRIIQ